MLNENTLYFKILETILQQELSLLKVLTNQITQAKFLSRK